MNGWLMGVSRVDETFPFGGLAVSVTRSMALRPDLAAGLPLSRQNATEPNRQERFNTKS